MLRTEPSTKRKLTPWSCRLQKSSTWLAEDADIVAARHLHGVAVRVLERSRIVGGRVIEYVDREHRGRDVRRTEKDRQARQPNSRVGRVPDILVELNLAVAIILLEIGQ